ncbi:MAG: universal stress protein [Betaproteobacteria bacterium]|nr:universal stress protein [Betaproteobacteria bacterium]
MFKHILVATDGSKLAARGVKAGVRLAKSIGAKVTGVYVIPPYTPPVYGEAAIYIPEVTPKRYKELTEKEARKALALVEIEAQTAGVACKTLSISADQAWQGITRAAGSKKCDLIVVTSHGRGGLAGLILGSETTKVLAHTKIPVLVCR